MMRAGLAFWYLVLALLSESSAYSNPEEVCELVRFTLNMEESIRVPKLILLQWTPRISQEVRLSARGGCANASRHFKWFSSNRRIVSVTPYGVIQAKSLGVATVKVVSTCDPQNYDLIIVKVFAIQTMRYDMDDMKANADSIFSKPSDLFKLTLLSLMFPLGILIGHLIYVYYPANPHIEPCSSTSHSDQDCHRTKRVMLEYFLDLSQDSKNKPSESFMLLAICTAVTVFILFRQAGILKSILCYLSEQNLVIT